MVIGTKELMRHVEEYNLVENLCERELKNPEGAGFDLRVGTIYKIKGDSAFLGEEHRSTPEVETLAKFESGKKNKYVLKPNEYILVETMEKMNLPRDIACLFRPRTTLFRSGVTLYTAMADPGYKGTLTFGMVNHGNTNFEIELGARIARAVFFEISGLTHQEYRGQWQGGRVSTQGKMEKQV